jgi:uncharacterized membrane protein YbhN (UPF0104 family)
MEVVDVWHELIFHGISATVMRDLLKSRRFNVILQMALFVAVAFWLLSATEWRQTWAAIQLLSIAHIALAMVFMSLRFMILGTKWWLAINQSGLSWPWFLRNEWHILFLEFVIPVPDAEDLLRVSLMRGRNIPWASGLRGLFWMRISGLSVLSVLLMLFLWRQGQDLFGVRPALAYATLALLFIFSLVFMRPILFSAAKVFSRVPGIGGRLAGTISEALAVPVGKGVFLGLLTVSLCHMLAQASVVHILLHGIGHDLPLHHLLLLMPFLTVSFLLPLSIQGLGLPEATLVFLLPLYGVPETVATAVSAVHLACYVSMILFGGALFAFDNEISLSAMLNQVKVSLRDDKDDERGRTNA